MTGTQLDHYRVLEKLGEGGMGVVYKALDLNLDRVVALKLLSSDLAAYPELTERFKSEARLQATLSHPNVALLYTFFFWQGSPAIVMEFIEGETFQRMVRERGPVAAPDMVPLFKQALMGVGAAHRHGIVHRDIKPANIMLSRNGLVKVMDFGIAKAVGAGARSGLTRTNTAMGTSWYMSPEQVLNRPVDARSDIYALGVTLYEMLCGEVPFQATSEFEIQRAHVNTVPPPPNVHCPNIPPHLVAAVTRALEKDPDARFQSVEEFSMALGAISVPVPTPVVRSPTPVPRQYTPVPPSGSPAPAQRATPPPLTQGSLPKAPTPVPLAGPADQPQGATSHVPLGALPNAPTGTISNVPPQASNRRRIAPAAIAGILLAVLALGGFLYFYAASQDRERAKQEAMLSEQQDERQREAAAEKERARREAAEDQRNADALKQRIQQEEAGNGKQPEPPSAAPKNPVPPTAPDNQDDQGTALSNALGGASSSGIPSAQPSVSQGANARSQRAQIATGSLAGLWKGTYMCLQQGQNEAEMSISASPAGGVTATMMFQVPNAKPGSYLMRGMFDQSTGQINLQFTRWVNHPLNYLPANLTGVVDLRQGVMRGQVIAPGCGNFEVWRSR